MDRFSLRDQVQLEQDINRIVQVIEEHKEEAAKHTAALLGFVPVAVLVDHVQDYCGGKHDLLLMERELIKEYDDVNVL